MTFPTDTIDLPHALFRVRGGSFRITAEGEYSSGQWDTTPRSTGPRFERWMADFDLVPFLKGAKGDLRFKWEVFIARLRGTSVAFRMHDPLRVLPRGVGAGVYNPRLSTGPINPGEFTVGGHLIDGSKYISGGSVTALVAENAARYANTIHLEGLVPSSLVFKEGDHIGVGGNLYMVMEDAMSDANGESSFLIAPELWKPALAGDVVQLYKPTARFVLRAGGDGTLQRTYSTGEASITGVEVPYIYE